MLVLARRQLNGKLFHRRYFSSKTSKESWEVSFKNERPFVYGAICTYAIVTWIHHSAYKNSMSFIDSMMENVWLLFTLIFHVFVVKPGGIINLIRMVF